MTVAIFKVLNDKNDKIDMLALRKLAFKGVPSIFSVKSRNQIKSEDCQPNGSRKNTGELEAGGDLRSIVWRVQLGVLSETPSTWVEN